MKSGYVAITGKPNVGKSTFLNALLNRKVAIVSPKPQTTRNQIRAIYKNKNTEIAFIDTPGWHEPNNKLDMYLNSQIKASYKQSEVTLLLIDLTRKIDEEDLKVIHILKEYKVQNVIVLLTKFDLSSERVVNEYQIQLNKLLNIKDFVNVSSKKLINLDKTIEVIAKYLKDDSTSLEVTDNDNFIIAEAIREQVIYNTKQELPYATGVIIELNVYDEKTKTMNINATIVVEKESQKPIIIGRGGSMIKKIGANARKELLSVFDTKINLKLFVKVQKEWRNNEKFLSDIGYGKK